MKDIFNLRLVHLRQFAVWGADIVLDYLSNFEYDLPLKNLSEKLVILLLLLSGQRNQTMKALNIKDMLLEINPEGNEKQKTRFSSASYWWFYLHIQYDVQWWYNKISFSNNNIAKGRLAIEISSDASSFGWETVYNKIFTGGAFNFDEMEYHINSKEIMAAIFSLKTLVKVPD